MPAQKMPSTGTEPLKVEDNLAKMLEWMDKNQEDSRLVGFKYAPNASKDIRPPDVFSFGNIRKLHSLIYFITLLIQFINR
jgi:hypothetical protein